MLLDNVPRYLFFMCYVEHLFFGSNMFRAVRQVPGQECCFDGGTVQEFNAGLKVEVGEHG